MKQRQHDPLNLDVEIFARDAAGLQGDWPAQSLERLAEGAAPESSVSDWPPVRWQVRGECRPVRGGQDQIWLHLQAEAEVVLTCQRCLKPMAVPLALDRDFHFVRDERTAAELDADSEDDVLALTRHLDVRELVEDELLLDLPLVPRHEVCPDPLPAALGDADEFDEPEEERPNPFAALAALKGRGTPKA